MLKLKNNEYEQIRMQYSRLEPELRRKGEMEISLQEQQVIFPSYRIKLWDYWLISKAMRED